MTVDPHSEEFRRLFAEEASTCLTRLSEQLLDLEMTEDAGGLLAAIFRDVHTIKGSAGVVGFDDVGRIAHIMEEILDSFRDDKRPLNSELIDALLSAVDHLQSMIPAMANGESCTDEASEVEVSLLRIVSAKSSQVPDDSLLVPQSRSARVQSAKGPAEVSSLASGHGQDHTTRVRVDRLDELVRLNSKLTTAQIQVGRMLAERLDGDPTILPEYRELSRVTSELQEVTILTLMAPVATVVEPLRRIVRDLSRAAGKQVGWEVSGLDTELDRGVLEQLADPLIHLVRNAVDHGIESGAERASMGKSEQGTIRIEAKQLGSEVVISVFDDGKGIDIGAVREQAIREGFDTSGQTDEDALYLIFRSGFTTSGSVTAVSGRGVGLDVVRSNLEAIRGRIEVRTTLGVGTEFRISVPITLAVLPCLVVRVAGQRYGIPMHSVVTLLDTPPDDEITIEGHSAIWVDNQTVPITSLALTLGLSDGATGPVVVLAGLTRHHAFRVDELVEQREVMVKGIGRFVHLPGVLAGASVEPDGLVMMILDATGVIDRARRSRMEQTRQPRAGDLAPELLDTLTSPKVRPTILVVDNALMVRELQRSILERAGYNVLAAANGEEAMACLSANQVELVLTDIEMPKMDGFGLTEAIRQQPQLASIPIVMLTTKTDEEDFRKGLEVGADAYIGKVNFDERDLVATVQRLLGHLE